jgi:undecaprenyl phosphate-alpha-L-ara4N flippase subunit ArnE
VDTKLLGITFVLCAVVIEAFGQTLLKKAAESRSGYLNVYSCAGLFCFAVEAVIWTLALKSLDVSVAYPMGSLAFVGVLMLSRFWLKETVSLKRWAGVVLILCGTAMVGLN